MSAGIALSAQAEAGRLVLVVGPSGAGKDSVIRHARDTLGGDTAFRFPRRVVTRPPSPAEDNAGVDDATFAAMERDGAFAISWTAHGLRYGILREIDGWLAEGSTVICNVSRTVVDLLRARYRNVLVVEVTAPREVLAARLAARGRAEDGDTSGRVDRSTGIAAVRPDLTISNAGALDNACRDFLDGIRPPQAKP